MQRFSLNNLLTLLIVGSVGMIFQAGPMSAQSWIVEETFGGNGNDRGYNSVTNIQGGSLNIGAGRSFGNPASWPNVHVEYTDGLGNAVWETVYEIRSVEFDYSIIQLSSGDIAWTCGVNTGATADSDVIVVLTDAVGTVLWSTLIGVGNGANEVSASIIESTDGDLLITGYSDLTGSRDVLVARLDIGGALQWATIYGDFARDIGRCIREVPGDEYIIAGQTASFATSTEGLLFRIDGSGGLLWSSHYGGFGTDAFAALIYDGPTNSVFVTGVWNEGPNSDIYVVNADAAAGTEIASQVYTTANPGLEGGRFINRAFTPGNWVITGSAGSPLGGIDAFAMEIPSTLTPVNWFRLYGGVGIDMGRSISFAPTVPGLTEEGYWIFGMTDSFGAGNFDHYLIRTNLVGKSGCDQIEVVDPITVSGENPNTLLIDQIVEWDQINVDELPIFSQLVICPGQYVGPFAPKQADTQTPSHFAEAVSLGPNPVRTGAGLLLEFIAPEEESAMLYITDMQGRELKRLLIKVQVGSNKLTVPIGNWAEGMYLLRIGGMHVSYSLPFAILQ